MLNTKKQGPTEPQAWAKAKNQNDNEFKSNDWMNEIQWLNQAIAQDQWTIHTMNQ